MSDGPGGGDVEQVDAGQRAVDDHRQDEDQDQHYLTIYNAEVRQAERIEIQDKVYLVFLLKAS